MHTKKRVFMLCCFITSIVAVGLLSATMATDYWVTATAVREVDSATKNAAARTNASRKFIGKINLGLFHGIKELEYGLGVRRQELWVTEVLNQHQLFNLGLWLSTLIFLCLAISWAMVSAGFSLLNVSRKPVETISGSVGIYLWNLIALICLLIAIILYVILFYVDLNNTLLTQAERTNLWSSKNRAVFGYSFWMCVGALGLFLLNGVFVKLSGQRLRLRHRKYAENGGLDGVMMY